MIRKIVDGVYNVGVVDWDRTLFDEIVPLPQGTSYNAYLIMDEKVALVDTAEPYKWEELKRNIEEMGIEKIDYIISNHAEQDHSGCLPFLLEEFPEAKIVTNEKCKQFEMDLLHIPEEKFMVVKEGDVLSLGNKTLEFIMTPWVHWPETMSTYLREDKIMFTCDFFGSHVATSHAFARDYDRIYHEAKRYYAEIMMPFRSFIERNIKKIESKEIKIIAPSHGPAYDNPSYIINAYKEWIDARPKNLALIAFVSMHGSTRKMVDYLINALTSRGIEVRARNLITTDLGELAMDLVDAATIIIATPTMLAGPHPAAVSAAYLINALRPKARFAAIIGSYGWGGRAVDILKSLMSVKIEFLEPLLIKGLPRSDDYKALDELAEEIKKKHDSIEFQ
ncbi:MAG: FprA family A-type flavoprotein [Thermoplasmata archaeon]|nr:MAG: FprA family A-type flavoprotein [Thermoplasmata archaeon]